MSFKNKVVLVTGAAAGIGAVTAIEFAKEGAHVTIVDKKGDKLNKVGEECNKVGPEPLVIEADIADENQMKHVIDSVIKKFNQLNVLINNAAVMQFSSILESDFLEAYDYTMNVNVRAQVLATFLAAPFLIQTKGNIVNISSVAATTMPRLQRSSTYNLSKAALNYFSRSSGLELSSYGVRVNTVSPGAVVTEFFDNCGFTGFKLEDLSKEMPLKRVSQPIEVANIILFLASDKAVGVTGSDYVVDNGYLLTK